MEKSLNNILNLLTKELSKKEKGKRLLELYVEEKKLISRSIQKAKEH